jgi:NACalpha-BTF3-like transcription factor
MMSIEPEIDYLMGEIDLCEAAEQAGISSEAFRKRLERHTVDFKEAILAMNNEQ